MIKMWTNDYWDDFNVAYDVLVETMLNYQLNFRHAQLDSLLNLIRSKVYFTIDLLLIF